MKLFSIEENYITITRGDTASILLSLDNYNLQPGDKVTFTVKKNIEDINPVIQKEISEFDNGKAQILLYTVDTDLEAGKYVYDIQLNLIDGRVETVVTPTTFKVDKGVTD